MARKGPYNQRSRGRNPDGSGIGSLPHYRVRGSRWLRDSLPSVTDESLKEYTQRVDRQEYVGHRGSKLLVPNAADFEDTCLPNKGYHKVGCPERMEP